MLQRILQGGAVLALAVTALLAGAGPARAVVIDKDLRAAFADKANRGTVPVLMVYDRPNQLDPGLIADLKKANPKKRRRDVIAALKRRAGRTHGNAASILNNPAHSGQIENLEYLYLANAISFEATWEVIESLGVLEDEAVLHLDRRYDLTAATQRGDKTVPAHAAAYVDTAWSVLHIGADRVWNELGVTGAGVVVGHIDTGVWLAHDDLADRLWTNPLEVPGNGLDDDGNGFVDDVHGWDFGGDDADPNDDSPGGGHGTHTAGSVVGDGSDGTVTGVAPGAHLMALKVWQNDGGGGTLGMIWAAEQYAVENGAQVLTMSLGLTGPLPADLLRAERYNANNIREAGVVFFNSAGNDHWLYSPPDELGLTARVPAPWSAEDVPYSSTSGVVSVGGTGYQSDALYSSSSRGPAKWDDVDPFLDWPYLPGAGLIKPDVAAPGVGVNSTVVGGGYSGDTWNGTSMACPHAAGLAALMLEKNPSLSPAGIDSLMELTAVDLGVPGKDTSFGAGRIDAYAAVSAVPADLNPILGWRAVVPDPAGDGVLEPGETCPIAIELRNVSGLAAATGVTAGLTVAPDPYVTVSDPSGSWADLGTGASGANTGDPFGLVIDPAAPQGHPFTMVLTVTSNGGGYEATFDIPWYVGLPEWRTHDAGGMYLTVTDQGTLGFLDDTLVEGEGMGYADGLGTLFIGSFWAGTDVGYVCNRDYSGAEVFEWQTSPGAPNGRVRDLGALHADETFRAVFTDAGHASPRDLHVEQTSMAFGTPGADNFVILEYRLTNRGATDLPALYNGVFCDFDVGDAAANEGATDPTRNLTYMFDADGVHVGVALLGAPGTAVNTALISNATSVYPNGGQILDGDKINLLRGLLGAPSSRDPEDLSAVTSSVVDLPAGGGTATVAYALVIGGSLAEIQAAVDLANAVYSPVAAAPDQRPTGALRLLPNAPNPFNPITEIRYVVPRTGHVELAVYDLSGRRVRTLVQGVEPAGIRAVSWDGRDDGGRAVPSGMYLSRVTTVDGTVSRKMTLVK